MSRSRGSGKQEALTALMIFFLALAVVLVLYSGRPFDNPLGNVIRPQENTPETTTTATAQSAKTIKIASWNLQRFGKEKAENRSLMDYYAGVLKNYDIAILQELTDSSGESFQKLCGMMKGYFCAISDRLGNTSYKEQYGLIYRNAELLDTSKGSGGYVRAPYTYHFRSGSWSFYLTTIHTDPDNVKAELSNLDREIGSDQSSDRIIMGDLNADCSYYKTPPADFASWVWIIPDEEDTTVKATDCAYDRIIINRQAENNFLGYGIMRNVSAAESDHYLVYAEYGTDAA